MNFSRLHSLAQEVGALLKAKKETLSLVETTTGGLIGASLLSVEGASSFFRGGVNAYSLQARQAFLGWNENDTASYDGPNEAIVLKLAMHMNQAVNSTWCFAESGVAGPTLHKAYRDEIQGQHHYSNTSASRERPFFCRITVGYNPFAVVSESVQKTKVIKTGLNGRAENMQAFAEEALLYLKEVLSSEAKL